MRDAFFRAALPYNKIYILFNYVFCDHSKWWINLINDVSNYLLFSSQIQLLVSLIFGMFDLRNDLCVCPFVPLPVHPLLYPTELCGHMSPSHQWLHHTFSARTPLRPVNKLICSVLPLMRPRTWMHFVRSPVSECKHFQVMSCLRFSQGDLKWQSLQGASRVKWVTILSLGFDFKSTSKRSTTKSARGPKT